MKKVITFGTFDFLHHKFPELAFERLIAKGHTFKVMDVTHYFSCELDTVEDFENATIAIETD